jgi:FAD/FMN-containing dehydrogenase
MAEFGATLHDRLKAIVGDANVLSASEDVAPYLTDCRGRYHGATLAVVRPATTDEVAAVVATCAQFGVAIVPQGGNTGMCGGAPNAPGTEIMLSLARMNRIRAWTRRTRR